MDRYELQDRARGHHGIASVTRIELEAARQKYGKSIRNPDAVILDEHVYSNSEGSNWGGENRIVVYASLGEFETYQWRCWAECLCGDGYARADDEIRMDEDCAYFNDCVKGLVVADEQRDLPWLAGKLKQRIDGATKDDDAQLLVRVALAIAELS